jgi:hypothetical protein
MGLDQYLEVRKYIDGGLPEQTSLAYEELKKFAPDDIDKYCGFLPQGSVSYLVACWRKANAIHGWFLRHLDVPVENCEDVPVLAKQLEHLRDDCRTVLAAQGTPKFEVTARELLPPTEGFFFGVYDLDEWYIESLLYTADVIDHLLTVIPEDDNSWTFTYRAWW